MNPDRNPPGRAPSPDQLVAYADGVLDGPARAAVETWLADHPEARAEVEAWRRLDRLWRQTEAPEPAAAAWDAVLARVEAALPAAAPAAATVGPARRWLFGLGAAAAVVAGLLLARPLWRRAQPPPPPPAPIVQPEPEVAHIDPDEAELQALRQVELLSHEQVTLNASSNPNIRLEDWATPMIVDPRVHEDQGDRRDR
jgi:anti-sigma factor RsiW